MKTIMKIDLLSLTLFAFVLSCGSDEASLQPSVDRKTHNSADATQLELSSYDGQAVVAVALNELGHDDDLCEEPGCYYAGGDDKVNWCSEFVSWVYHKAGYSFTDGSFSRKVREFSSEDGSWMHRSTSRIIRWFQKHEKYIDRDSPNWNSVKPQAGDYVFIGRAGNENRRHSGLVEFVDEYGTLHAIEGNNSRRDVARYRYPLFKTNTTDNGSANGIVLGIGLRTGANKK